jgi:rhodanese-related sulfurtransferase
VCRDAAGRGARGGFACATREVVVLDVRPAEEYAAGHIPGALSIPVEELADRIAELPADTEVVAYCRGEYCVMAHDAVRLLNARGRRAARLSDGMLEWRLAEMPVAIGEAA